MEEVWVRVIYNTLLDSNEGDLSPHTSWKICYSYVNENKISDRETALELIFEPERGINYNVNYYGTEMWIF